MYIDKINIENVDYDIRDGRVDTLSTVATSGSYNDLTDKPEAVDLSGYVSNQELEAKGYLTEHQSLADYAMKSEIPSLEGYALTTDIPDVSNYQTAEQVQVAINNALATIRIAEEASV